MKAIKTMWVIIAAVIILAAAGRVEAAPGLVGIEIRAASDFYQPLAPYGYWVELPRYGWCWYPAYVDQAWRPYSTGRWVWTDDGWYWESEEPWSWATYHYGRWDWDSYYGWVWVPGVEWAPSWVAWRESDNYVGWAPLSPACAFGDGDEIYGDRVVVPAQYFTFVERRHFCERIRPQILVVNNTIIHQTVNITRINRINRVIINHGPSLDAIERANPGRVFKTKIERRLPAEVRDARQQSRDIRPTPRPAPEVIRGTRQEAAQSAVVRPVSPDTTDNRGRDQGAPPPRRRGQDQIPVTRPPQAVTTTDTPFKREPKPSTSVDNRRTDSRPARVPPAPVIVQPKPQPLAPTAVQPSDSDTGRYRKLSSPRYPDDNRRQAN